MGRRHVVLWVLCLLALLSTYFRRNISTGLTKSGELAAYGTDVFGLVAFVALTAHFANRRRRRNPQLEHDVVVVLVFDGLLRRRVCRSFHARTFGHAEPAGTTG